MRDGYRISVRRACDVLVTPSETYLYRSKQDTQESLRMRLKELAYTRVSYWYRRLHILLLKEGWQIYHKRVYRLYREEGLRLRRRKPKRYRSLVARHVREQAGAVDDIWTMDFMSDQLSDGRRIRV